MPRTTKRTILVTAAATVAALGLLAAGIGAAVLFGGWYNIGATRQHWQPIHSLLETGMRYAVRHHARDIVAPRLGAGHIARGAQVYHAVCQQCHGGPGMAQDDIGQAMQPLPGPLVDASRHWRTRELYWITRHGIKMSGMPAWEYHLADADIWAVVAFLQRLPGLSAREYAAMTGQPQQTARDGRSASAAAQLHASGEEHTPVTDMPLTPSAQRGRVALNQYACRACHRIPGVTGSDIDVGPPLGGIGRQRYLAGKLPNTPENMVRWIRDPQAVSPGSAMPTLGVTEADARDMAAYLATMK